MRRPRFDKTELSPVTCTDPEDPRQARAVASRRTAGFTMMEVVVMAGIIVVISSVLLANFPSISQSVNLRRSAQRMVLAVRDAQNLSLGVREIEVAPGDRRVPSAYGVFFDPANSPSSYLVFADLAANGRYDGEPADLVVETVSLTSNVTLRELHSDIDGANPLESVLNITFTVPFSQMGIQNGSGPVGTSAKIVLAGKSGVLMRSVIVRTSGQVEVR